MGISPTIILILGGAIALLLLIVGIAVSLTSERSMVEERLGKYVEEQREEDAREAKRQGLSNPVSDWLNKRVEGSSYASRLSKNLGRADLKLKPGEYIFLIIASIFLVGLVGYVIGQQSILLLLVGGLGGAFLPGMYVKNRQNKRLQRFGDQLADMLNLMVNGLRAGYSTMQAMEAVSKELPSPINEEFRRVVQEMQLGVTMERAMANLLDRVPSDDLDLVVTAINVQREVGGNLAEILDTISFTIRERVRIKGEIRVLTTQVMYSGRFLSLLPIIVILILYVLNREYMMTYVQPESGICGYIALGVAAVLIVAGYFSMQKLGDIEV
ncbi:MAG TPA: type II secretion system F family protein [Bellilinea sp.]|nr:type II secretion system F family protein [Bellilinea sp.]